MNDNLILLKERHSDRAYSDKALSDIICNKLNAFATYVNTHESGIRFVPIYGDDSPFCGVGRSYGMFKGVRNYLVVMIDSTFEHALERAGYYAEQFAIEALKLGLGSCFVGGTFSREHVNTQVEVYEKIPFVIPFGYPDVSNTSFMSKLTYKLVHRKTRQLRDFFDGTDAEFTSCKDIFPWLDTALEAVACAPSALNSQPVRLKVAEFMIKTPAGVVQSKPQMEVCTINADKYAAELGIAKFNLSYALNVLIDWGENAGIDFENHDMQ